MYTVELIPAGLHASLSIKLEPSTIEISSSCPLFLHLSLPPSFIADRYQLNQLHEEGRLGSYDESLNTFGFKGERDLEVPVYKAQGSELLIRLNSGTIQAKELLAGEAGSWEIPLHLRYQVPVIERWIDGKRNDIVKVELNYPLLFFACENAKDHDSVSSISTLTTCPVSFDYPALLNTSSLHLLTPSTLNTPLLCSSFSKLPTLSMPVPTGVLSDLNYVESINFVAIWSGMILISWAVFKLRRTLSRTSVFSLDKKYALPYEVVDALLVHFIRFKRYARVMSVLWHQSFLVFVQRYKQDLTAEQKDALLDVLRAKTHPQITPEIRREIVHSVARGEEIVLEGQEMDVEIA